MAASWPTSLKSFTPVVDNATQMLATQINQVYEEVEAMQASVGINVTTIDDTVVATNNPASVAIYLDMLAYIIKTVTGVTNWYDTPTEIVATGISRVSKSTAYTVNPDERVITTHDSTRVPITLPESGTVGRVVEIVGEGDAGWQIKSNANVTSQQIIQGTFGSAVSSDSAIELWASITGRETIRLICIIEGNDQVWSVVGSSTGLLSLSKSAAYTIAPNERVITTHDSVAVPVTLPEEVNVGDVIEIVGEGDAGWELKSNASVTSQKVVRAAHTSPVSASNAITLVSSVHSHDVIRLVCIVNGSNQVWAEEFGDKLVLRNAATLLVSGGNMSTADKQANISRHGGTGWVSNWADLLDGDQTTEASSGQIGNTYPTLELDFGVSMALDEITFWDAMLGGLPITLVWIYGSDVGDFTGEEETLVDGESAGIDFTKTFDAVVYRYWKIKLYINNPGTVTMAELDFGYQATFMLGGIPWGCTVKLYDGVSLEETVTHNNSIYKNALLQFVTLTADFDTVKIYKPDDDTNVWLEFEPSGMSDGDVWVLME